LSTEEASERLGIKEQTLKSRLHRGRLFLRTRLSEFASGLSLHRQFADGSMAV
jgi:DNA-directed RNA polymerase specialized sigma24 family protein